MSLTPFERALVAHLVADWLLQNDWMAHHKCKLSHPAAWVHGGIHALALGWALGWVALALLGGLLLWLYRGTLFGLSRWPEKVDVEKLLDHERARTPAEKP